MLSTLLQVQRSVSVHSDLCSQLLAWANDKRAYLSKKEAVSSLAEAEVSS